MRMASVAQISILASLAGVRKGSKQCNDISGGMLDLLNTCYGSKQ